MKIAVERRTRRAFATVVAAVIPAAAALYPTPASAQATQSASTSSIGEFDEPVGRALSAQERRIFQVAAARVAADRAALSVFRPRYPFWQHILSLPDGSVAFGSAADGRLLAVFPAAGDWTRTGHWHEPPLAGLLRDQSLALDLEQRKEQVAHILAGVAGPIVHYPTVGRLLLPNVPRYGSFLGEWAAIYQRFGVPPAIGLAQAIVESGLSGTVRSEAGAIGFCQWLEGNWQRLNRLAPHVIEARNQTTQAAYCAAYLTILATKYGSFVPALSDHHAGATNVGRTLINGEWLGGTDVVSRYFLGSQFASAVRERSDGSFRELHGTYGPRSFRYTELVFGNTATVGRLRDSIPQSRIFALRTSRSIPLTEVTQRTGLSDAAVRRYNPALVRRVPARATLYLPVRVSAFGRDVSFWHRPPSDEFAAALADFVALSASPEEWNEPAFEAVLRQHQRRFEQTRTEEGSVMAVVLAYMADDIRTSRRATMLKEYRTSERIGQLFEQAVRATRPQ